MKVNPERECRWEFCPHSCMVCPKTNDVCFYDKWDEVYPGKPCPSYEDFKNMTEAERQALLDVGVEKDGQEV